MTKKLFNHFNLFIMKVHFVLLVSFFISLFSIAQQPDLQIDNELSFSNGIGLNLASKYLSSLHNYSDDLYVIIKTNIPFEHAHGMTSIRINYWGYSKNWETVVGFYIYNGKFFSPNAYSIGLNSPNSLKLFREDGKVCIALLKTNFNGFGNISVHKDISATNTTTDWAKNWSITHPKTIDGDVVTEISIHNNSDDSNISTGKLFFNQDVSHDLKGNTLGFTGGNIGIGTGNPLFPLDVRGFTKISASETEGNHVIQFHYPELVNGRHHYGYISNRFFGKSEDGMFTAFGAYDAIPNSSGTADEEGPRPLILQPQIRGGNVGIGLFTTPPDAKLFVQASAAGVGAVNPHHGIKSILRGDKSGTQYGIYSSLSGANDEGKKYCFYAKSNSTNTLGNVWAGYFEGKLQVKGDFILEKDNANMLFFPFKESNGEFRLAIVPNQIDNENDYNWNVASYFSANGEREFRINDINKKAFFIKNTTLDSDVFRIMGDGKVWATEINVRTTGDFPDYVFNGGYNLMNLDSLNEYITINNKLPKMPSAKDVSDNGVNIGELNVLLVEKVEELTLYTIEQQKLINELLERIVKLEEL